MARNSKDKVRAVKIIVECATKYKENLLNNCLLFICVDKHGNVSGQEVSFEAGNFLHLTGCKTVVRELKDKNGKKVKRKLSAPDFFWHCVDKRLSEDDFEFSESKTAMMKLQILPILMEKNLSANSIGEYNNRGPVLQCNRIAGGVKACMGIKRLKNGKYVPNSALKADIREYIVSPLRIIATYRKKIDDEQYSELVYKAKKIEWSKIIYPVEFAYIKKPE